MMYQDAELVFYSSLRGVQWCSTDAKMQTASFAWHHCPKAFLMHRLERQIPHQFNCRAFNEECLQVQQQDASEPPMPKKWSSYLPLTSSHLKVRTPSFSLPLILASTKNAIHWPHLFLLRPCSCFNKILFTDLLSCWYAFGHVSSSATVGGMVGAQHDFQQQDFYVCNF